MWGGGRERERKREKERERRELGTRHISVIIFWNEAIARFRLC
jgi:hypothetical protein